MPQLSQENVRGIALEHLKRQKNTEKIDILTIENSKGDWLVRGTCPVDLQGHQWAEKFEVTVDSKGRIKSSRSALL
jgi:hypothetical protein